MPKFLSRSEIYRMLQRELPEFAYPDGAPSAYFSTADMDSIAYVAASGYSNLERIYDNYFPQSADEKIEDWEITVFGKTLSPSLTLQQRRDRIIAKIRSRKGITLPDMIEIVKGIIGEDKLVDISEWGCSTGGWMISISQLGIETILNGQNLVDATGPYLCAQGPEDFGKTEEEWLEARREAYTYQVNIYGYVLTPEEYREIDEALTIGEPARSTHIIEDGLDPDDMLAGPVDLCIPGNMLLEDDGILLLEDGGILLLDNEPCPENLILLEQGGNLLLEDGGYLQYD